MVGAQAETLHHAAAHDAPAQRAHHFPEFDAGRISLAACLLIPREQILARAETADRLVDLAEAPGIDADPAEILHGVAEMREFPVQHRAYAIRTDDQISVAEIAMHQRDLCRRTWIVVVQPAQRQFEHRPRPVEALHFAFELADLLRRRHLAKLWQLRARQAMDAGRDLAELARQKRP